MTPRQVVAHLSEEQIEELLIECYQFLDVALVTSSLIKGLTGAELESLFQRLSHHIGPNEFDLSD